MKKVIMGLMLVGACRTQTVVMSPSSPAATVPSKPGQIGASDPTNAVKGLMVAAKTSDLQAMSNLWGDQTGLARDRFSGEELQKRELFVMRCLRHETWDIVGDAPGLSGARAVMIQVSYGDLTRSATLDVVRGPSDRWYIRDIDTKSLQDICMRHT